MKDLTGQRFGRLIAIRPTQKRRHGSVVWECVCDCGKTAFPTSADLCAGKSRSCGCMRKEMAAANGARVRQDLTGQTFGRLTVIKRSEKRKKGALLWECRCICGNIVHAKGTQLKNGYTQSCGCLRAEHLQKHGQGRKIDLTGQRFGRLTVVRELEERQKKAVMWECICDCGNTTVASRDALRSGDKRSCGCLRKENAEMLSKRTARNKTHI